LEDSKEPTSYETINRLLWEGELDKVAFLITNLPPHDALKGQLFQCALLFFKGQYDEVIKRTSEISQESRAINDWFTTLWALFFKLWSLNLRNKFIEFDEVIEEVHTLKELSLDPERKNALIQEIIACIYGQRALKETFLGNLDHAMTLGNKGLTRATELNSKKAETWCLLVLTFISTMNFDLPSLMKYTERGLAIGTQHNLKISLIGLYYYLGQCYRTMEDYDSSFKYFNQGLLLSEEVDWKFFSDLLRGGLGHHYIKLGDYKQALKNFTVAFNSAQEREDYYTMRVRLGDLGLVYRAKGEIQSALDTFNQILELSTLLGDEYFQSYASFYIGSTYFDQKKYSQALQYFVTSFFE
jgi:tetratricopeptide (TPR) repeat protein